jgi:hypothetical protein
VLEIGKSRKVRDGVKFLEQLADDLVRVFALAEALDLLERAHQRLLGLTNRDIGEILALPVKALLVFEDFAPEEVG